MYSDEREPDSLDVDIVALVPTYFAHFLAMSWVIALLKGNHSLEWD